jgi:hypothetical protein
MLITTSFHIKQQKFSNSIKLTIIYDAVLILAVDKILPLYLGQPTSASWQSFFALETLSGFFHGGQ